MTTDELREQIEQSLYPVLTKFGRGYTGAYDATEMQKVFDEAIAKCFKLTQRIALEARIDELNDMHTGYERGIADAEPQVKYAMRPILQSIEFRIKALKSQLRGLQDGDV